MLEREGWRPRACPRHLRDVECGNCDTLKVIALGLSQFIRALLYFAANALPLRNQENAECLPVDHQDWPSLRVARRRQDTGPWKTAASFEK
jgi:hypothetical protein